MSGKPGTVDDSPYEVTLGPVPCHECHARLYFVAGKWQERVLRRVKRGTRRRPVFVELRDYEDHECTARSPFPAPGRYVGLASPRMSGAAARGGRSHYRRLLGESR